MADVISLNQAKKARAKVAAKEKAAENRAKFGRKKSEKTADQDALKLLNRHLDDHRRDIEKD